MQPRIPRCSMQRRLILWCRVLRHTFAKSTDKVTYIRKIFFLECTLICNMNVNKTVTWHVQRIYSRVRQCIKYQDIKMLSGDCVMIMKYQNKRTEFLCTISYDIYRKLQRLKTCHLLHGILLPRTHITCVKRQEYGCCHRMRCQGG